MKSWSASEIRRRLFKEAKLKTLARKLRDWLNRVLEEDGHAVAAGPSSTPEVRSIEDAPDPVRGSSPWEEPAGPPEDWLRRVREGAPGLLLPAEEGGMPRLQSREVVRNRVQQELTFAAPPPAEFPPAAPARCEEPRVSPAQKTLPAPAAAEKKTWPRLLKQEFLHWFARGQEKEKTLRPEHSEDQFQAVRERPVSADRQQTDFAHWSRPLQTPAEASSLSRHPVEPAIREGTTGGLRWSERVKQSLGATIRSLSGKRYASKMPVASLRRSKTKPPSGEAPPKGEATRRPAGAGSERDWSSPQPAFRSSAQTPGVPDLNPAKRHWPARVASAPVSIPTPRVEAGVFANRKRPETATEGHPHVSWSRESNPVQPLDQWLSISGDAAKSPPLDPWPELPEEEVHGSSEWRQFLRSEERLRALDLEQRGGR